MGKKNKLLRFSQLNEFENVYQNFDYLNPSLIGKNNENIDLKGVWNEIHFKNNHPLILELACGGGEYTVELARQNPTKNYIGVDIKGARLYKGARIALNEKLKNAAFLRTRIQLLNEFFAPKEVDELWITFPDPFLKDKRANNRLTSPLFLDIYQKILKKDHMIHLKTDSEPLYLYTLSVLDELPDAKIHYKNEDIYSGPLDFPELETKTHYEYKHLSNNLSIKYLKFTLNNINQ